LMINLHDTHMANKCLLQSPGTVLSPQQLASIIANDKLNAYKSWLQN
jgi:hypothetical protein